MGHAGRRTRGRPRVAPRTAHHPDAKDSRDLIAGATRAHQRRAAEPAARHRPRRDRGVAGVPRRRRRQRRPQPRALPDAQPAGARPASTRSASPACAAPTTSTRSRPSASRGSPATSTSSAGSAPTSAGTPRSWCTARSARASASAATSPPTPRRASLYEVGFNHFFRGKDHPGGGDQICFQGHASPGIYARAFLEGRLSEHQLDGFRQELSHPGGGLSSYPHPRLMPEFWEFPTVSMGLGPINAIYQARFNRYLHAPRHQGHRRAARVGLPRRRRDGRARVARRDRHRRPRGAGQPHLRRQLQPAAPRRPGARQRQGHPGAGVVLPRRRLERHQGDLGPRAGTRCSPPTATARWST